MHVTPTVWLITIAVTVVVLAVDVFVIGRRPHEPSMREAGLAIAGFSGVAILFGVGVWVISGPRYGAEFFAGWLTEYSLSVDNLFIFVIIMANLRVPRRLQQFALMVGIVLALVFRGVFIALGAAAIERFSWVFFVFGGFLIWTAYKLFTEYLRPDDDDEATDNAVMRWVKRTLPSTDEYHGTKLAVRQHGRRLITPMFYVIVALGTTDLLFALDSIPAIYGLTQEPYLVFAANVFALDGAAAVVLPDRWTAAAAGVPVGGIVGHPRVHRGQADPARDARVRTRHRTRLRRRDPDWVSLLFIIGTLTVTTVASLVKSKRDAAAEAT